MIVLKNKILLNKAILGSGKLFLDTESYLQDVNLPLIAEDELIICVFSCVCTATFFRYVLERVKLYQKQIIYIIFLYFLQLLNCRRRVTKVFAYQWIASSPDNQPNNTSFYQLAENA